jgi:hypothetical protein
MNNYFGRHQLGEEVRLQLFCRNGTPAAIMPTSAPTLDVWLGSTRIFSGLLMFPTDRVNVLGLFLLPIKLLNLASGIYNCVFRWQSSTFNGVSLGSFEIVDGGGSNGNCVSMIYYNPPSGQFLVRQTDAGLLKQGRNPQS